MARTKLTSGQAASAASKVVPDPREPVVPPHEDAAPWDEEGPGDVVDLESAASTMADEALAKPARSKSAVAAQKQSTPNPSRGWGGVIEHAFTIDPESLYQRLYDELRLGDDATEYGAVLHAADRAEQNAIDATRLARHAKLEDEQVSRKVDERLEVLRTTAKNELEKEVADSFDEKLKKTTKKAPTIQDITDRMQANWPDEYNSLSRRKEEMHGVLRVCEGIESMWRSRCATLRVILERVAPSRPRG